MLNIILLLYLLSILWREFGLDYILSVFFRSQASQRYFVCENRSSDELVMIFTRCSGRIVNTEFRISDGFWTRISGPKTAESEAEKAETEAESVFERI